MNNEINSNWQALGKCVGRNPKQWELADNVGNDWQARARALCTGCPVLAVCALSAIEPLCVGTVRGGVYIPTNAIQPNGPGKELKRQAIERLEEVASNA